MGSKLTLFFLFLLVVSIFVISFKVKIPSLSVLAVSSEIGVYLDQNCLYSVSFINWGELQRGEQKTVKLYVRNEGLESIDVNVNTENWNPIHASGRLEFSSSPRPPCCIQVVYSRRQGQTSQRISTIILRRPNHLYPSTVSLYPVAVPQLSNRHTDYSSSSHTSGHDEEISGLGQYRDNHG